MKSTLLTICLIALFTFNTKGQNLITITGTVCDESQKAIPGAAVMEKGTTRGVITGINGEFKIQVTSTKTILVFSFIGLKSKEVTIKDKTHILVVLESDKASLDEVTVVAFGRQKKESVVGALSGRVSGIRIRGASRLSKNMARYQTSQSFSTSNEDYANVNENKFFDPISEPLSTFSVDVDRASYTNVRRYINQGTLPPVDAIRIEEMINYFNYDYTEPQDSHPFAIHHEVAACPWNTAHYLLKVALQGKRMKKDKLPASNLVFLLDVSGSMNASNKLPLLKSGLKMLVNELRDQDKVSIVVYAGAAGVVLEPTSGADKKTIVDALDKLSAGGSTAGGAGLKLAYKIAHENFIKDGNNRIILATDGDFNVGISSNQDMETLIESERNKGIYITVAGLGMGNYKDSKMEIIADKGNGNYFYIDNIQEARKALVEEFGGTLFTIAKDVKFQLEFNPMHIAGYRLIGYENRLLKKEDFNDDKKDAGEIGAGHTVTALYELIPVGAEDINRYIPGVDNLKYQANKRKAKKIKRVYSDELLTLKLRYKQPEAHKSTLLVRTVKNKIKDYKNASSDFKFVASVAAWGMKLRQSDYISKVNYSDIIHWAKISKSKDEQGYRAEMIRLMESAEVLSDGLSNKEISSELLMMNIRK